MTYPLRLLVALFLVSTAACGGGKHGSVKPGPDAGPGNSDAPPPDVARPDGMGDPDLQGDDAGTDRPGTLDARADRPHDLGIDQSPDVMAPPACAAGNIRCNPAARTVELCSAAGEWMTKETCTSVCDNNACAGQCLPGARQCDGLAPRSCNPSGQWESGVPCPAACTDGVCTGACTAGDKQCGPNQTPQTCSGGGQWVAGTTCPYVCSGRGDCTGVCTPGATQCVGGAGQFCDTSGRWAPSSADCIAPQVLAISPPAGATGVRADIKLVITFSEAMNPAATEAAFTSSDIPMRTFAWNPGHTVLTVTPAAPLEYVVGRDAPPRSYAFSLTTTASDAAGNKLVQPSAVSFTTLRRLDLKLLAVPALSGSVSEGGDVDRDAEFLELNCASAANGQEMIALLTFDLGSLPDDLVELQSAALGTTQILLDATQVFPTPAIEVGQVHYGTLDGAAFTAASTRVGTLGKSTGTRWRAEGTPLRDAVWTDYGNRDSNSARTQLRLRVDAAECEGKASFDFRNATAPADAPTLTLSALVL
jgi:hypothetical protein